MCSYLSLSLALIRPSIVFSLKQYAMITGVGVLLFCMLFWAFFVVFGSVGVQVSRSVSRSVRQPTERSVTQSVGQPTERSGSQSVGRPAGSGESVSRSSSGSGESVSQSVRLPTEPSISRAVDLALHLQTSEYGVPESPNEGAWLRYMMSASTGLLLVQVLYNPGPENHKKYPEITQIRPESVRLLQVLYNPGPENHKKYSKKH